LSAGQWAVFCRNVTIQSIEGNDTIESLINGYFCRPVRDEIQWRVDH
jgi:hypothetical protein